MASILDPRGVYFGSRIISSEDSTEVNGKSLDVLPDVDESFVLILDDLDVVWPKYLRNLILMKKYVYFSQTGPSNETIKVFRDEDERKGALSFILEILKEVHGLYYQRGKLSGHCDVRDLLEIIHMMMYS
ncbi:hypothetical protein POM88_042172 [Heracleum sosnowskyi]|uniref:protein-serine/threonine phosphatase n=1 Tax=Heracleum sosnowskyi TaxID=360622 RepID=A0AAD8HHH0_9APIA|nr:hypothetical protein POM88_042172 [Heracleum sosnowskyi]